VSPVIATVLLIAIVIVLALIIFLWARGFIKEVIQKKGMSAEQACEQVNLEVAYSSSELEIINQGNIPVYRLEIKKFSAGSAERQTSEEGLGAGQSTSIDVGSGYDKIEVFPVILGEAKTSKKAYTCTNSFATE